jgi:hypothetical protein
LVLQSFGRRFRPNFSKVGGEVSEAVKVLVTLVAVISPSLVRTRFSGAVKALKRRVESSVSRARLREYRVTFPSVRHVPRDDAGLKEFQT